MASLVTLIVLLPLTLVFATLLVDRNERRWLLMLVVGGWMFFFPLLMAVNNWMPFTDGGDDITYFQMAAVPSQSFTDAFDITRFVGQMEQPGYPWLLSIINQFTGPDILAFKVVNLAFFIMLAAVWYRIGLDLEGLAFGKAVAVSIFLLTPLWFYSAFLLKDMLIALLQSLFLLGVVRISKNHSKKSWALILITTLMLIPFRIQLLFLNLAVLNATIAFISFRTEQTKERAVRIGFAIIVNVIVLVLGSNSSLMGRVGIYTEQRVLGTTEMFESIERIGQDSQVKRNVFPLLYLFSETSGLSPKTWKKFDATWFRGVLVIPWIFTIVPFFIIGLVQILRIPKGMTKEGVLAGLRSSRFATTPWMAVLMFIITYAVAGWWVGNTTRWRVPDMPAIAAVAATARMSLGRSKWIPIQIAFIAVMAVLLTLYYQLRGV